MLEETNQVWVTCGQNADFPVLVGSNNDIKTRIFEEVNLSIDLVRPSCTFCTSENSNLNSWRFKSLWQMSSPKSTKNNQQNDKKLGQIQN